MDFQAVDCRRATVAEERRIIDGWIAHMVETCTAAGVALDQARICHWSAAEPVNLRAPTTLRESAIRVPHGQRCSLGSTSSIA